jgi:peptidoglycan/LPS O-acetylase OafA/YrhL
MPLALAPVIDALCIFVFVILGRRNHDEGEAASGVLRTAAPFLIGAAVAWMVGVRSWRPPTGARLGVIVWSGTLIVGMILRRTLFDKGTAASFIVVATVFLGLFLLGWRVLAGRLLRRRAAV